MNITLVPIFLGIYNIKYLNHKALSVLYWMCCMLSIELYSSHQYSLGINNMASFHLMIFLNGAFAAYFFYHAINNSKAKRLVITIATGLLVYLALNPFTIETLETNSGISMTVLSYCLMVFSFIYLFDLLKRDEVINLFSSPEFLIAIAILLYFGTTQIVQLLQIYVARHMQEIKLVFRYVDISIMIVYYFLIGVGLWKTRLQKT